MLNVKGAFEVPRELFPPKLKPPAEELASRLNVAEGTVGPEEKSDLGAFVESPEGSGAVNPNNVNQDHIFRYR